jgi:hypothetical protein
MKSSWVPEADNLAWTLENAEGHGAWLPPVPDFASHSLFGGASWFPPHPD